MAVMYVLAEWFGDLDHGAPFQIFADRALAEEEAVRLSMPSEKGTFGVVGGPIKVFEVPIWPAPIIDWDYLPDAVEG